MDESRRLQKVRENTYSYLVKEVDPIISNCITHLLLTRPSENVPGAMLSYLKGDNEIPAEVMKQGNGLITKREQRMFLATKISPVLTKLMTGLAQLQPVDVVKYLIEELDKMIQNNECIELDPNEVANKLPKPVNENRRPMTSKGKLGDALAYDRSRIAPTTTDRPGTAPELERKSDNVGSVPSSSAKKTAQVAGGEESEAPHAPPVEPPAPPKTIQIAVLGTGGSGKTSIINALQGDLGSKVKPTLGFRPTTMMMGDDTKVKFYDLGGEKKIRDIWSEYYHDVHAVIYVVDSTVPMGTEEWNDIKAVFTSVNSHLLLSGKPFLVIANKADVENALDAASICEELDFSTSRTHNIVNCTTRPCSQSPNSTTHDSEAVDEDSGGADKRLEQGVEWLLTTVNSNFDVLDGRVTSDTKTKAAAEAKKRLARERKVLRNKIASVFYSSIPEDARPDVDPATPEDIYAEDEGFAFLADEIGKEKEALGGEAEEVARLVGFQRLALQIVGALFAPISKKKTPMSWVEIKEMITEIRTEMGL